MKKQSVKKRTIKKKIVKKTKNNEQTWRNATA